MGNEYPDQLAKKGAMMKRKPAGHLEMHKQMKKIKHQGIAQQRLVVEELLKDKACQNIRNRVDLFSMPRKTAVVLLRLQSGNDHLCKINCLPNLRAANLENART